MREQEALLGGIIHAIHSLLAQTFSFGFEFQVQMTPSKAKSYPLKLDLFPGGNNNSSKAGSRTCLRWTKKLFWAPDLHCTCDYYSVSFRKPNAKAWTESTKPVAARPGKDQLLQADLLAALGV